MPAAITIATRRDDCRCVPTQKNRIGLIQPRLIKISSLHVAGAWASGPVRPVGSVSCHGDPVHDEPIAKSGQPLDGQARSMESKGSSLLFRILRQEKYISQVYPELILINAISDFAGQYPGRIELLGCTWNPQQGQNDRRFGTRCCLLGPSDRWQTAVNNTGRHPARLLGPDGGMPAINISKHDMALNNGVE